MPMTTQKSYNKLYLFIAFAIFVGFIYLLSPILLPFFIGGVLAYICNPLVKKLMCLHLSRNFSVSIVFFLLFFLILLLSLLITPIIQKQTANLIVEIPKIQAFMQNKVGVWLAEYLDVPDLNNTDAIKNILSENLLKTGGSPSWFFQTILHSGKALFEGVIDLILIPFVTFYLLRDWEKVIKKMVQLIPEKMRPRVIKIVKECDSALSAFFRGQLLVMLSLAIFYSIGLTLLGLQTGVVIGLIIGLISIVPYLGAIIGLILACLAALIQFGTMTSLIWVGLLFVVGHSIENFYLTPKLIGDRIGLHPVIVIFAILAGGTLFGFLGILLALPVASILIILFKYLKQAYFNSHFYQT